MLMLTMLAMCDCAWGFMMESSSTPLTDSHNELEFVARKKRKKSPSRKTHLQEQERILRIDGYGSDMTVTTTKATQHYSKPAPQNNQKTKRERAHSGSIVRTPRGEKYHYSNCPTVRNEFTPISVADAKAEGLTPCKVCNPPEF